MNANLRLPREVAAFDAALESNPALLRQAEVSSNGINPYTPQPNGSRTIHTWDDVPDVLTLSAGKIEWLAEGIIPRASVVLLAGEPGSYKSWLALSLLRALLNGGPFLGRQCAKERCMYLDKENPLAVVQERLAVLGIESMGSSKIWGGWVRKPPLPVIGNECLLQMARELKPLIIFDSLIRFHGADENSATEMAEVMQGLRDLANAGATVLALHHRAKSETSRYRGSSDIAGGVDVAFSLMRDRQAGVLKLECFKNRLCEEFSMTLRPDLADSEFVVTEAPEVSAGREYSERLAQEIQSRPGRTQSELIAATGIPQGRARALLEQRNGELWRIERGPHNAKRFFPPDQAKTVEIEV